MKTLDEKLRPYATDRQWQLLEAAAKEGSDKAAARVLKIDDRNFYQARRAVAAKASRHGYSPDHNFIHPVPDGFKLANLTQHYVDGELRQQWIKPSLDAERQHEMMVAAIEAMTSSVPRIKPTIKMPKVSTDALMACYPIGDHHLGMMAWHEESGDDYDLSIAETVLMRAMEYLVSLSPDCEQGLLAVLGDFLHIDSFKAVTPTSGYLLDADSRYPKMVKVAIRVLKYAISALLRKHAKVRVIFELGNHDPSSAIFMMQLLASVYEDEPRVSVDVSPMAFHYFQFGKNMVVTNHGDKVALRDLPSVIAADQPKMWGETEYRYCWVGHVHHHQTFETKSRELRGIQVETFQVLAPKDAHAASFGYRAQRSMKSIVLHHDFGEQERHTFNPARFL